MKCASIFSVTSKSAMTPSFIGLMATMLPGVRPSISLASLPTASMRPLTLLIATIDGSLTTMPLPRAYTHVLAVPRSMARSLENKEKSDRRFNSSQLLFVVVEGSIATGDVDAVLALFLDPIHGRVSGLQEALGRVGCIRKRRDADRRREAAAGSAIGKEHISAHALAQPAGHRAGAVRSRFRQDDGKFIAAKPRDDVGFACAAAD